MSQGLAKTWNWVRGPYHLRVDPSHFRWQGELAQAPTLRESRGELRLWARELKSLHNRRGEIFSADRFRGLNSDCEIVLSAADLPLEVVTTSSARLRLLEERSRERPALPPRTLVWATLFHAVPLAVILWSSAHVGSWHSPTVSSATEVEIKSSTVPVRPALSPAADAAQRRLESLAFLGHSVFESREEVQASQLGSSLGIWLLRFPLWVVAAWARARWRAHQAARAQACPI